MTDIYIQYLTCTVSTHVIVRQIICTRQQLFAAQTFVVQLGCRNSDLLYKYLFAVCKGKTQLSDK